MSLSTIDAYQLMHDGTLALADIEANGIRIDKEYCKKQEIKLTKRIRKKRIIIEESEEVKKWKSIYKNKFNMDSNHQLGEVLFNYMGYKAPKLTPTGKSSVDQEALGMLDIPMVKDLLELRKLNKAKNTYLDGIVRFECDGYIRPSFNLHTVKTYRSSSDKPNFQNIPVRDPKIKKLIRTIFIPREGHQLMEVDYDGAEIRVSACYHQDPTMISYIQDSTKDLHRDMAMECYILNKNQITKEIRYCGKNMFVFPEFYGDYYISCAEHLWKATKELKLITKQGTPLKQHLKEQGMVSYKKFENHIKRIERNFWYKRFPVYTAWKDEFYNQYLEQGYLDTLTGFRCSGLMKRNDVINYPVQGSAFHCLLWSLIQINKWLKEEKLNTRIIGQIHDSIVFDLDPEERDIVIPKVKQIMCKDIRKEWDWIIVPLEVEIEIAPINKSWYEKEEIK